MNPETLEPFVDADQAAKFLFLTRRYVLALARGGKLPGHAIGDGARRVWRFRLSELAAAVSHRCASQIPCGRKAQSLGRDQSRSCGDFESPHDAFRARTITQYSPKTCAGQDELG